MGRFPLGEGWKSGEQRRQRHKNFEKNVHKIQRRHAHVVSGLRRAARDGYLLRLGQFVVTRIAGAHRLDEILAHFPDRAGKLAEVGDD